MQTDLMDLPARVEAATGAVRKLDFAILCVVDPRASKTGPLHGDPRYTASLDAAMTLVSGSGRAVADLLSEAMLRLQSMPLHLLAAVEYREYLARFVTAAALRARATQGDTSHADG